MFCYNRTIYLRDTDAAGVAYFASLLSICHEAYEASLAAAGTPLSNLLNYASTAIPIVHAEARFLQPLSCGDRCAVRLRPQGWQAHRFAVAYELYLNPKNSPTGKPAATARTQHYCIHPATRQRQPLPESLQFWYHRWAEPDPDAGSGGSGGSDDGSLGLEAPPGPDMP